MFTWASYLLFLRFWFLQNSFRSACCKTFTVANTLVHNILLQQIITPEAAAWRVSVKYLFSKVSNNSQENICVGVSF